MMKHGLLGLAVAVAALASPDYGPQRERLPDSGNRLRVNKAKKRRKAKLAYASRRRNSR